MKQILLMIAVVALVGCGEKEDPASTAPSTPKTSAETKEAQVNTNRKAVVVGQSVGAADKETPTQTEIIEAAIRKSLKKPTGGLTKADLASVTKLFLHSTKITDEGLKDIAKMQQLTSLLLDDTEITDAGLKDIAKLQNLARLSLSFSKITDVGLKDIAKLQNLAHLDLINTKITYEGAAELKKALPKCRIFHNATK